MGYWLINTAGIGGIVVALAFVILLVVYARVLRWICDGGREADQAGGKDHAS